MRRSLGECFEHASRLDIVVGEYGPPLFPESGSPEGEDHIVHNWKQEENRVRVTFLVVEGGSTGVELAWELSKFSADVTRPRVGYYTHLNGIANIILVHRGPDILPQFET